MFLNKASSIKRFQVVTLFLLAFAAACLSFIKTPFFTPFENMILDFNIRQSKPAIPEEKIILVLAQKDSLDEIGQWPWPRSVHADIIENRLSQAKTIAYDAVFFQQSYPEQDEILASAIQAHGNVVLGTMRDENKNTYTPLYQPIKEDAAGVGFLNSPPDADNVVRKVAVMAPPAEDSAPMEPSLFYSALIAHGYTFQLDHDTMVLSINSPNGKEHTTAILDSNYSIWNIGFEDKDYIMYEFSDVYNGRVPKENFENALVYVGISVYGASDIIQTPQGTIPNTKVLANATYTLLSGFNPQQVPPVYVALSVFLLFCLCAFLTILISRHFSFLVPLILGGLSFYLAHILFTKNIAYLPCFNLLFWVFASYIVTILIQLSSISREVTITTIPISQAHMLENLFSNPTKTDLKTYLLGMKKMIEEETGIQLIDPYMTQDNEFLKGKDSSLLINNSQHGFVVFKNVSRTHPKNRVLIPHLMMDENAPPTFTLLGTDRNNSPLSIRSIAALIMNTSISFNAIQQSADKQELFLNLVKCMVAAIDAKDPITAGHSQRVAEISVKIGEMLHLPQKQLDDIQLAGMIHDLGKIGIPDSILNKPGIFTWSETEAMRQHPEKGLAIMKSIGLSPNILDGIVNHHERMDGKGYPRGKTADEFGIFASIIKISDVYDALISKRQYKKAWPLERVCNILYEGRGTEFDPEILDLFLESIQPPGWVPPLSKSIHPPQEITNIAPVVAYASHLSEIVDTFVAENPMLLSNFDPEYPYVNNTHFFEMEWGEGLNSNHFLLKNPLLIHYNTDNNCYYYALKVNEETATTVIYSFLRGFLTSGLVLLHPHSEIEEQLLQLAGEPTKKIGQSSFWDQGKVFIVLIKSDTHYTLCYITKYAYGEASEQDQAVL